MKVVALAGPACVLLALIPAGCGRDVTVPDRIEGEEVGAMAERELEAENPELVPGSLVCPDLDLRAGESVRCLRSAELSGGRVVKVGGRVEVTSLVSGGRLHVSMDAEPAEFGLAAHQVEADLRRRLGLASGTVACPYLRGRIGARITCRVDAGVRRTIDVRVTGVDPKDYRTTYVALPGRPS